MTDVKIRRKLVIVGDGAAGKTSLLNVFAVGHFPESYVSSLILLAGVDADDRNRRYSIIM
jgi:GTPase SAR1 family protein